MTTPATSTEQIDALTAKAETDTDFPALLTASLQHAKTIAQAQLDPALYNALRWPVDIDGYVEYLNWFSQWIPQQESLINCATARVISSYGLLDEHSL